MKNLLKPPVVAKPERAARKKYSSSGLDGQISAPKIAIAESLEPPDL